METRGLQGLKAGDTVVIVSSNPRNENPRRRTVKTAGRVWITVSTGLRYSIETGEEAEHFGYQDRALTVPQYEDMAERRRLFAILDRWGMDPKRRLPAADHELTTEQLCQVAALLETFEAGEAGS